MEKINCLAKPFPLAPLVLWLDLLTYGWFIIFPAWRFRFECAWCARKSSS